MNIIQRFMRVFFHLLYHPFAFAYDLVAATASFGNWKDWTKAVLPFIKGNRILELGHGPGHLQRILLDLKLDSVAIDESAQMGMLARSHIGSHHKLTRGLAQQLPFSNKAFDTIIATFPTEYIFHTQTLSEIGRCLSDGGRLVVLPAAWPKSSLLKWLYQITGESPAGGYESYRSKIQTPFTNAGLETEVKTVEAQSSTLMIITANK